jgi:hypothetical protein
MPKEWWEDECHAEDVFTYPRDNDLLNTGNNGYNPRLIRYENMVPLEFLRREYSDEEKKWLRPICETLAMLSGGEFTGAELRNGKEPYEQWLPEAAAIFYANGGSSGRAGHASWMKDLTHESKNVERAWTEWRTIKSLSRAN